jgi:cholesterol transport system auxiliary component
MTSKSLRGALRLGALVACAVALSGCISLLPKTKPAHLYTFGHSAGAASTMTPPAARTVGIFLGTGLFQRESAGDRLMTISVDNKIEYVAQTRWAAPAVTLFDEAVLNAFDTGAVRTRLVSRGEPARSDYALRLDVRNFETRYDQGSKAAPLVVVRARALLTRDNRNVAGEQIFEAQVRASDNRVGAIVPAYDAALSQVLAKLVAWADATAVPVAS